MYSIDYVNTMFFTILITYNQANIYHNYTDSLNEFDMLYVSTSKGNM